MRHFLDVSGGIPADMPAPAARLVGFLGSIIEWVTSHPLPAVGRTNVRCRRSPGRKPCLTQVRAGLHTDSGQIVWRCPKCDENGVIYGWESTPWDRSPVGDLN